MIEAALVLLAIAVAVFAVAVRLGMIVGTRLDRLVWSPPTTDEGAELDPIGAEPQRREPDEPAGAVEDEGRMG